MAVESVAECGWNGWPDQRGIGGRMDVEYAADERFREMDQDTWVKRVIHRKDVDYFPDGRSTRRLLEKVSG